MERGLDQLSLSSNGDLGLEGRKGLPSEEDLALPGVLIPAQEKEATILAHQKEV